MSASAQAGSRESSKERAARKACLAGDYTAGVSILSDLFLDTKDPTYIYNQARCLQQNGRFADALFRFEEYVRVGANLSDPEKADAQKQIADCRARLGQRSGQGVMAAPPPAQAAGPATIQQPIQPAPPAAPSQPISLQQSIPQPEAKSGSGLRTAGILTTVVGGAALVAGVAFNLKVNSMASDFQNLNGYTDSKESDRKTFQTLGWVGFGVGAACIATGAVLYYLGVRAGTTAPALALGPDGSVSAVVKGAF